jgi:hypothetical protein
MHNKHLLHSFVLYVFATLAAFAQGTAFTYQGRLNNNGAAATGTYDFQFTVYDAVTAGGSVGAPVTVSGVGVTGGLFAVTLDFGASVFTGPARWLQIAVRMNGAAALVPLTPRQSLTPSPYAIHAGTASNVVSGAAVKSLNNLKDDVSLVAGANVTLTPSGNTLTIAAPGRGGGGPWLLNGTTAYYNAGNVGIGTSTPTTRFTVNDPLFGIEHTDGTVRLATYLDGLGGWLGTISNHKLNFYVNNGVLPSMTVDTAGNVGVGTINPVSKLDVRGVLTLEGGDAAIFTAASGGEQNRYLQLLNSSTFPSASGLKAGGLLVADNYGYANPGKNDLVVKGNVSAGGDATQARDRGGWVKAMAKVNANGTIAQQYSALGGTISASFVGTRYIVTFPFQVRDRFVSVTPFYNSSVGQVVATIEMIVSGCLGCSPNDMAVNISDAGPDNPSVYVANEFFIVVY